VKKINIKINNLFIVFFCLIIFLGCATKSEVKKLNEEDLLRARVAEFWDYRIKLELDKCYYYEYPLLRKKINIVNYIKSFNTGFAAWKDYIIKDIKLIDAENAEVQLGIKSTVKIPGTKKFEQDSDITERWITADGIWYHVPKSFYRDDIKQEQ